jgi:hypothetical protein
VTSEDDFYAKVRKTAESRTGRPAYLATDEEWAEAVDEVLVSLTSGDWRPSDEYPHLCPYCGDVPPYGDERHMWISAHLNNLPHRWWWETKKWVKETWQLLFYPPT